MHLMRLWENLLTLEYPCALDWVNRSTGFLILVDLLGPELSGVESLAAGISRVLTRSLAAGVFGMGSSLSGGIASISSDAGVLGGGVASPLLISSTVLGVGIGCDCLGSGVGCVVDVSQLLSMSSSSRSFLKRWLMTSSSHIGGGWSV